MLSSLHIENIAVIKELDIDFNNGFSVLSGETGAGKSIIIDSINLLLGKKIERELIRKGESSAMVSGLFTNLSDFTLSVLKEAGVSSDEEGNLFIQRSINTEGRSQIRINGRAANIALLKSIGDGLINIHGQDDTRSLVSPASHLQILDKFAANDNLLEEYRVLYREYDRIQKEINAISEKEQERIRYTEILEYQIKDIDTLNLKDGEEEELIDKKAKIKNSERITKHAGFVFKALKGSEKGSVSFLLDKSYSSLMAISDVIPEFSEYAERLKDALYSIDDIAEEVYASIEDIDVDPTEKLNEIESRLDKISKIKRKYGLTIRDVLDFRENAFLELEKFKNSDDLLKELNIKLIDYYNKALAIAEKIHDNRINAAKLLECNVCETLAFLDMEKVIFRTLINVTTEERNKKLGVNGIDTVEFFISTNKGLDAKPLSKVASGGELARIMLALRSAIADKDGVGTVIFDEIDAGVSGKTARKIGIKMQSFANSTQLLCVTHSAQIASLADEHFLISKKDDSGITETSVKLLDNNGRIAELSRILGGIDVTQAQRDAAEDMLKEKEFYKNKITEG